MYRYFNKITVFGSGDYIYFWKSKGLPNKNITAPNSSDYNSLNPQLSYLATKAKLEFEGICFKAR